MRIYVRYHTEVPSPGVAAFNGFAAQAKLARFVGAGTSALHTTIPVGLNPGNPMGTQGIGV